MMVKRGIEKMFFNSTMPSPFSLNEQNGGVLVKSTNSVIKMTWCTHERHNGWICHILFAKNSTVGIAIIYIIVKVHLF